jgi:hypothetical protein
MEYPQSSYPRLAALMGEEKSIAIFRRFDDLSILCLLSLQAEIVQLEKEFRTDCVADALSGHFPASSYCRNFKLSRDASSTQFIKLKDIKALIKEYSERKSYF